MPRELSGGRHSPYIEIDVHRPLLTYGAALLLSFSLAQTAWAQGTVEGAGGLGAPAQGTVSPSVEQAPPQTTQAESAPTPQETANPGEIPPPPGAVPAPSGYAAPRYVVPSAPQVEASAVPAATATRLRALEGSLGALASRGSSIGSGIASMVSGGVSIALGIVNRDERTLASYLYLWGSAGIAGGIIDVALRPRASRPSIEFAHMPMRNAAEIEARLQFGENALESIARRARIARILDASLNVAVGALVLPVYYIPTDFSFDEPFDYFVLIGSAVSVISGVIKLATTSTAERRWSAYQDLRRRLEMGGVTAERRVRFEGIGAAPIRGGAAATATVSF